MEEKHFLFISAIKAGWSVEVLNIHPFLIKYTKGHKFFYSNSWVSININQSDNGLSSNKYVNYKLLSDGGFSIVATELIGEDFNTNLEVYENISNSGQEYVVVKPIDGSGAVGIRLIKSKLEYIKFLNEYNGSYVITKYFNHEIEIRFLIVLGKVEIIHPKYPNVINNIRPKQREDLYIPLSKLREMKNEAISVAKYMNFNYLVVDFIVNEFGDYKIVEVNTNPNFRKYVEKSTNHFNKFINLYVRLFNIKEKYLDFQSTL